MTGPERDFGDPQQRLIAHLTADFTPIEDQAVMVDPDTRPFSKFVTALRSREDIAARLTSAENEQLGQEVMGLLEPAPITDSFRGLTTGLVRMAHAHESKVSDAIAPDRLGLSGSGTGIFEAAEARAIEARCLRAHLQDTIKQHVMTPVEDGEAGKPIVLDPGAYTVAMTAFNTWLADYFNTHDQDPFEAVDMDAYLLAATQVTVVEAEEAGFGELLTELDRRREQDKQ